MPLRRCTQELENNVAHHDQLFVVDLEDVRIAEQFFDEFVGVEVRTQVDVEELQSAFLGVA